MPNPFRPLHLRAGGVSVVIAPAEHADGDLMPDGAAASEVPGVVYWGADLGELTDDDLEALIVARRPPEREHPYEQVGWPSLLPDYASGWLGRPGLQGSRDGRDWSPVFVADEWELREGTWEDGRAATRLSWSGTDATAALALELVLDVLRSGLIRVRASVLNLGGDVYQLDALRLVLPVPVEAGEVVDFTGRHLMERTPQRGEFTVGLHAREQRSGRTGLDAAALLIAGGPGFGFRSGEVWGAHVGFSGNQELYAERSTVARVLGAGELLQSGEMRLQPGQRYESPWCFASYGIGMDALAARFHEYVRSGPAYPSLPRPVVLNTWEAVYFRHDLDALSELADRGAAVGAERFVLDDGWFGARRDDTRGLGDWTVSPEVWPRGLTPLIDHVHARGMDFGIWVEPEMVNLDSDIAREHPEWLFSAGGRVGYAARNQHVLDLTHPEAYAHIKGRLSALLAEYDIAYLKWDHNRLLPEAGHSPSGVPAIHNQTVAAYRLMDELRAEHPGLEIESCASGGGRVDLGVLEHTQRVWGSDTTDPLERTRIQRYMRLLVPPELIGSHVGATPSHTTGRQHGLGLRATPPFWAQFGLELDLRKLGDGDLRTLGRWVELYKSFRQLLNTGTTVNADHPDSAIWVSGVVAADGGEALFGVTAMERSTTAWPPGPVRLPGLTATRRYAVSVIAPTGNGGARQLPDWVERGTVLTGRVLAEVGIQLLPTPPERAYMMHLTAVDDR